MSGPVPAAPVASVPATAAPGVGDTRDARAVGGADDLVIFIPGQAIHLTISAYRLPERTAALRSQFALSSAALKADI
jgi:hypothetical protein